MTRPVLKLRPAPNYSLGFWMVWKVGSNKINKRHQTLEAAEAEASRLAAIHPERTFYVLESKAVYGAKG